MSVKKHHQRMREQARRKQGHTPDKRILPDAPAKKAPPAEAPLKSSAELEKALREIQRLNDLLEIAGSDNLAVENENLKLKEDFELQENDLRETIATLEKKLQDAEQVEDTEELASLNAKIIALEEALELAEEQDLPDAPSLVNVGERSYVAIPMFTVEGVAAAYLTASEWKAILKRSGGITEEEAEPRSEGAKKFNESLIELYNLQNMEEEDEASTDEDDEDA